MKAKHVNARTARATLEALNILPEQDFDTLRWSQVDGLLAEADRVKYRAPANANGSRARYFCALLQRRARKEQ